MTSKEEDPAKQKEMWLPDSLHSTKSQDDPTNLLQ